MKHSELVEYATLFFRHYMPFIALGPPGGGKTEGLVLAAERALGVRADKTVRRRAERDPRVIITHPVIAEEVDYRGIPWVQVSDGKPRASFEPFGFLREITEPEGPPMIVIFDDFAQARLSVQGAGMQVVHLREIDGKPVRTNVAFGFAGNRREDHAGVQGINAALLDRCYVLKLDFDHDELARWLLANEYEPLLAAFTRFRPQSIRFEAKNETEKSSTPRSIAKFGDLLKLGVEHVEVLGGAAGPAYAAEYLAYRKVEKGLVTIEEILAHPDKAPIPAGRDVLFAVMAGLSARLNQENLEKGLKYLDRVPPEFAVMVIKDLCTKIENIALVPAFARWAQKHCKMLGQ